MRLATRLPFAVAGLVGLGLATVIVALSQPGAAGAADDVVEGAAPFVNEAGVARMRADLSEAAAVAEAIQERGLPLLEERSGLSSAELLAQVEATAPGFTRSLADLPEVGALADGVIANLEARLGQFEAAESLPGLGLSLRGAAWAQLALAALLVVIAVIGLRRPSRRLAVVVLAIGVGLVALPLALGHPSKTADTDELLDSLRPFSLERVEAREAGLKTATSVFEGYRDELLPLVAERTGVPAEAVIAELAAADPALAAERLDGIGPILDRFGVLVDFSRRIRPKLVAADTISATTGMWLLLGAGIALVGGAGGGLVATSITGRARKHRPSNAGQATFERGELG